MLFTRADRERLKRVERLLHIIHSQGAEMSKEMDDLEIEVSEVKTVQQSAITLINGLAAQLAAAGTDPAKLKALRDSLKSSADDLAAAVSMNTPAAPVVP